MGMTMSVDISPASMVENLVMRSAHGTVRNSIWSLSWVLLNSSWIFLWAACWVGSVPVPKPTKIRIFVWPSFTFNGTHSVAVGATVGPAVAVGPAGAAVAGA